MLSQMMKLRAALFKDHPGWPSTDIVVRSWQDLGSVLAKILPRPCHGIHFAMVRSYQESHVHKKNLIVKSQFGQKKSTFMQIYLVIHDKFLLARYNI